MNATVISTVLIAVLTLAGVLAASMRAIYKRGGTEQQWTKALDDNTQSNKELTGELRDFKDQTVKGLHDLDTRVTVLESRGDARITVVEKKGSLDA